jgi:hypothetical protein
VTSLIPGVDPGESHVLTGQACPSDVAAIARRAVDLLNSSRSVPQSIADASVIDARHAHQAAFLHRDLPHQM